MKEVDTNPGKSYSVHSSAGCTVSDDSGWSKTLEAPEDYFTAHGSKVYIDDDAATARELFKLAPYQQLRLLGVVGGDKLPAGYTRLEYLESTAAGQFVDTGFLSRDFLDSELEVMAALARGWMAYCGSYNPGYSLQFWINEGEKQGVGSTFFSRTLRSVKVLDYSGYFKINFSANFLSVNGVKDETEVPLSDISEIKKTNDKFLLFARTNASAVNLFRIKIKYFKSKKGTKETLSLVSCLDSTGTPCMFDLVTKTPIYNSGSGAFIAGVENQVQLNNLLRKLPDRTGQDVGTLQVRLAAALQTPENEAKLDAMLAKNWEISQAA